MYYVTITIMSKRKRVVLSLEDKINIIDSLKKGENRNKLADEYGIGSSTISDIKKNRNSIKSYACKLESEGGRSKHRKIMKKPKNELLEDALYSWFIQQRSNGQPITGPLLCEKALQLNKQFAGNKSFVASNGWLHRFKIRHGIIEQGEDMSANEESDKDDCEKKLNKNSHDSDIVHNVDETVLNWNNLPSKSSVCMGENSEFQINEQKEVQNNETAVNLDVKNDAVPTHDEALQALDIAVYWFEKQAERDTEGLMQLRRIRDMAAMKKRGGLRQTVITKYFKAI